MTEYDYALEEIAGKTGIKQGVDLVRYKVFDAISRAYPIFTSECTRQSAYRQQQGC